MINKNEDCLKLFDDVRVAFDNGLYDAATNTIRQIAEVVAGFYVTKYELNKNNKGELVPERRLNRLIEFIWRSNDKVFNNIKKELLNFLCLAQQIGNKGSHPEERVEKWEVEFLMSYCEHYIKTQFLVDCGVWSYVHDDLIDVTLQFRNKSIAIYSMKAGCYARAGDDSDNNPICCDAEDQDERSIFYVTVDQEGWASFLAHTGKYVSVDMYAIGESDYPPIRAIGPEDLGWEKFKICKVDGYYAFKAKKNNKWVMCMVDWEENRLYAAKDDIQWWEMFDIKEVKM